MWIARDSNGTLWIFDEKPLKTTDIWKCFSGNCQVLNDDDWFPDVLWEDEEPRELILKPITDKGGIGMIDEPYYGCITSQDISCKTNPNPMFVREIRIDDVTKTEEHLLITTGNVICKIKLNDLKKIVKLIMEE